jgi:hypothetical protein
MTIEEDGLNMSIELAPNQTQPVAIANEHDMSILLVPKLGENGGKGGTKPKPPNGK